MSCPAHFAVPFAVADVRRIAVAAAPAVDVSRWANDIFRVRASKKSDR